MSEEEKDEVVARGISTWDSKGAIGLKEWIRLLWYIQYMANKADEGEEWKGQTK
jgi:hypothetical protein